jgi:hypothetical protein
MFYYKLFKVVYEKTAYKDTTFVRKNLLINIKIIYLHKLFSCIWFKMHMFLNPRPPCSLGRQNLTPRNQVTLPLLRYGTNLHDISPNKSIGPSVVSRQFSELSIRTTNPFVIPLINV